MSWHLASGSLCISAFHQFFFFFFFFFFLTNTGGVDHSENDGKDSLFQKFFNIFLLLFLKVEWSGVLLIFSAIGISSYVWILCSTPEERQPKSKSSFENSVNSVTSSADFACPMDFPFLKVKSVSH